MDGSTFNQILTLDKTINELQELMRFLIAKESVDKEVYLELTRQEVEFLTKNILNRDTGRHCDTDSMQAFSEILLEEINNSKEENIKIFKPKNNSLHYVHNRESYFTYAMSQMRFWLGLKHIENNDCCTVCPCYKIASRLIEKIELFKKLGKYTWDWKDGK